MQHPNVTVVESIATELVKSGWTGQILGVESTTEGKKDYVRKHTQSIFYECLR